MPCVPLLFAASCVNSGFLLSSPPCVRGVGVLVVVAGGRVFVSDLCVVVVLLIPKERRKERVSNSLLCSVLGSADLFVASQDSIDLSDAD